MTTRTRVFIFGFSPCPWVTPRSVAMSSRNLREPRVWPIQKGGGPARPFGDPRQLCAAVLPLATSGYLSPSGYPRVRSAPIGAAVDQASMTL
jgi:hypothetical protein